MLPNEPFREILQVIVRLPPHPHLRATRHAFQMSPLGPPSTDGKTGIWTRVKSQSLVPVWRWGSVSDFWAYLSIGLPTVCCLGQPVHRQTCQLYHEKEVDFSGTERGLPCPSKGKILVTPLLCCPKVASWGPLCMRSEPLYTLYTHFVWGQNRIFSLPDLAKPGPSRECPKVDGSFLHSFWATPTEETTFRAGSQPRLSHSGLRLSWWSYRLRHCLETSFMPLEIKIPLTGPQAESSYFFQDRLLPSC